MRKAVIDVGSNSLLLAVAEKQDGDWKPVFETSEITGFGHDVKNTGILSEEGQQRTLQALQRAFNEAKRHGAEPRAFATMAMRIADNASEFQKRANAQSTPVETLSGQDEADLGMASVLEDPLFSPCETITVVDVGGQSTEIANAHKKKTKFMKSYAVGTLALRDGILANESPGRAEILKASQEIDDTFGMRFMKDQAGVVVALGATATNLITIRDRILQWKPELVHGQTLEFEEISKFVATSFRLDDAGRAALPGIEKGRERTIHIGALILERALQAVCSLECRVSVRGWRYGLLSRI